MAKGGLALLNKKSKRWLINQGTHEVCDACNRNDGDIGEAICSRCNGDGIIKARPILLAGDLVAHDDNGNIKKASGIYANAIGYALNINNDGTVTVAMNNKNGGGMIQTRWK